jgi:DNA invertase Pin-like site-specific DNA recombinase
MGTYGYVRVSTTEQGDSGLGLEAQRRTVELEAERRGVRLGLVSEIASGSLLAGRPLLQELLAGLEGGDTLIVAKLDRLARNARELLQIVDQADGAGWSLVLLDVNVDTSRPEGRFMLTVMAAVAEMERNRIAERTREALAAKKRQGERLGRPSGLPQRVLRWIEERRNGGASLQRIADELTDRGVPTSAGRPRWHAATVRQALLTIGLDREAAAIRAAA